jgi:hypothetical protein
MAFATPETKLNLALEGRPADGGRGPSFPGVVKQLTKSDLTFCVKARILITSSTAVPLNNLPRSIKIKCPAVTYYPTQ